MSVSDLGYQGKCSPARKTNVLPVTKQSSQASVEHPHVLKWSVLHCNNMILSPGRPFHTTLSIFTGPQESFALKL